MTEELLEKQHSSFIPHALSLKQPLELKDSIIPTTADRYASSIASCNDFLLPSHAPKALLEIKSEQEVNEGVKEQQIKQKESLLKRLSLMNIKDGSANFFLIVKGTIASWKNKIWYIFGRNKPVHKVVKSAKSVGSSTQKISQDSISSYKKKKMKDSVISSSANFVIGDVEKKRIKEIEDASSSYEAEINKSDGGNIQNLMEMACKMSILVGSLGYRYNKKEMKDYFNHLEVNIKKRVKTYEGGRTWTYISVALQGTAAIFSFASLGSGFAEAKGFANLGKTLTGLGNTTTSLNYFGQASTKLGEIDGEKKMAKRTEYEHESEKLKQTRNDMDRANEKTHQFTKEMFDAWRNLLHQNTQAVKQAAGAA